ncbi:MAG: 50S ribosomal protein L29 [Clostridia bacterium]|nr:50S ribosomal protein L29 [Clostridia bacterium]
MKNSYKEMSIADLNAEESKLRAELFNLIFQNKVGQLQDTSRIRVVKKSYIERGNAALKAKETGSKE